MSAFKYYCNAILRQDFLTKFSYQNASELPELSQIVLSFGLSHTTLRKLLPSMAALLLISSQKSCLSLSKKTSFTLKLKGGVAIGCKINLRGKNKFLFFEKLVFYILPRMKNLRYVVADKNVFFKLDNLFLFKELEKEYESFQDLPKLSVNLNFKARKSQEIWAWLSALNFPPPFLNKYD